MAVYVAAQYIFWGFELYRVDIISSQAIFHMCPVVILLYENNHSIIYIIQMKIYIIQIKMFQS